MEIVDGYLITAEELVVIRELASVGAKLAWDCLLRQLLNVGIPFSAILVKKDRCDKLIDEVMLVPFTSLETVVIESRILWLKRILVSQEVQNRCSLDEPGATFQLKHRELSELKLLLAHRVPFLR